MDKTLIKKILNYGLPVLLFIFISYAYFPGLLEGKVIMGNDTRVSTAKASEIAAHREKFDEEPLWSNSQFSGMPAYFVSTRYTSNLFRYVNNVLLIGSRPSSYMILGMVTFYILLIAFGLNPWLSLIGALAFGLTTNSFVLLQAGHMSKVHTYSYMAGLIAGLVLTFRGKQLLGSALFGVFLALMLMAGHPQMTYYALIIALIYGIFELVEAVKTKAIPVFIKRTGLLLVAIILAVGSNFSRLYTQYEYTDYSTRGKTELTKPQGEKTTQGLDHDYILHWSNSIAETFALMIPDFRGGGNADPKADTEFYKQVMPLLKQQIIQSGKSVKEATHDAERQIGTFFYWGGKPTTDGPMYHGAIICFLLILGLFLVKGKYKWWLAVATALSIMLSWGKFFPLLSHLFIDYFPMYDKFRDATMLMVIAQLTMPLLGLLALNEFFTGKHSKKYILKALYWSFGLTGGLALLFAIIPSIAGSFTGNYDNQLPAELQDLLVEGRIQSFTSDAFRAFLFIAAAFAGMYAFFLNKVKKEYLLALLAVLMVADLWFVGQRYLTNDDLVKPVKGIAYEPSPADLAIKKDTDPNYKVLNLSVSTFNDASTSNHHFSVGGYDGAKMRRYQEFIERRLGDDIQYLSANLKTEQYEVFKNTPSLNMLNTKYVILNPQSAPLPNKYALGHGWFVDNIKFVPTADDEVAALKTLAPSETAIVNQKYSDLVEGFNFRKDPSASIKLLEYRANYLKYEAQTQTDQLAVFSEIYYPKGWDAYIDGEKTGHLNANYILRAIPVPAGKHTIEFRFHPKSYFTGNKVSFASSLLLLLLLIGAVVKNILKPN